MVNRRSWVVVARNFLFNVRHAVEVVSTGGHLGMNWRAGRVRAPGILFIVFGQYG